MVPKPKTTEHIDALESALKNDTKATAKDVIASVVVNIRRACLIGYIGVTMFQITALLKVSPNTMDMHRRTAAY